MYSYIREFNMSNSDFANYWYLLKGSYDKGTHAVRHILESETEAMELLSNEGALTVIFGFDPDHACANDQAIFDLVMDSPYWEQASLNATNYILNANFENVKDLFTTNDTLNNKSVLNILNNVINKKSLKYIPGNITTEIAEQLLLGKEFDDNNYKLNNISKFVVVGINTNTISDSENTARLTLMPSHDIVTSSKMNTSNVTTGGYGGTNVILNTLSNIEISDDLNSIIKTVDVPYSTTTSNADSSISQKIWLPSIHEIGTGATNHEEGKRFQYFTTAYSTNDTNRIRYSESTATAWWTRSVHSSAAFYGVGSGGGAGGDYTASVSYGVCPCFCI